MTEPTPSEAEETQRVWTELSMLFGINPEPEPARLDLWKQVQDPTEVLKTYYAEGNFYHHDNLQELATLANVTPRTARDTLARFRSRDVKSNKFVPDPPKKPNEFTEEQKQVLLDAFQQCEYIDSSGAQELARITDLTTRQITNWFCNQRKRVDRKEDFGREKRSIANKERQAQGLMRSSPFSSEILKLFEKEYEKLKTLTEAQGQPAQVPIDMLVEKTGLDRKKIRDWFSKRKMKEKRQAQQTQQAQQGQQSQQDQQRTSQPQTLPSLMGRLSGKFNPFIVPGTSSPS